jgi:O-antigen/teichoic acid export membrane protein
MDSSELDAYRQRRHRSRAIVWWTIVTFALVVGFTVGMASSLVVGVVVAVALIAVVQPVYLRWDRARWIARFPELADGRGRWTRRSW